VTGQINLQPDVLESPDGRPGPHYVLAFRQLGLGAIAEVGGKNASLGELIGSLGPAGVRVPDGFALTAAAFRLHLAEARLDRTVKAARTVLHENIASCGPHASFARISAVASEIARYSDRFAPTQESNGSRAEKQYGVSGARGEAQRGFPHVIHIALPTLKAARNRGISESFARLDALIAIMSSLDDTCLLHRGGMEALHVAKQGAKKILSLGGTSTPEGWKALHQLDADLMVRNASPGGSADLLAATLFLDSLHSYSLKSMSQPGNGEGFGHGDDHLSIQSHAACK